MKKAFTALLLTGTLFSCAAAKQDVIKTEPLLEQFDNKPAPSSNFGQELPEVDNTIQDVPLDKDEPFTIQVVPPPEGTELEVINPPLDNAPEKAQEQPAQEVAPQELAAANYPYLLMRPTGAANSFGNPIYEVVMFANGKAVGSVRAVTGRAHTQSRNRNTAGNESPLPNGMYRVATSWVGGTHPEVGGKFLPITPLFATNRSALGFHVDPSYNRSKKEDGTAGCIGTTTVAERDKLFQFAQQYKPRYLKVAI